MQNEPGENSGKGLSRRKLLMASIAAGATAFSIIAMHEHESESIKIPADAAAHSIDRFMKSMNCSQAVLETYAASMGMPVELARRVAAAFAGGMGMGAECGAVTGAFMVIGLRYGKVVDRDGGADEKTFSKVAEFVKEFKARHEHTGCSELLGVNMATPEGVKEAAGKGLFTTACPRFVRSAAEILDKMLA